MVKIDTDDTYELQTTASVSNNTWSDGKYGEVIVMAKRANSEGNRTPLLTGTLHMADGSTVECKQFRSTIWSNFEEFEGLSLRCARAIDAPAATSVDITSGGGVPAS